MTKSKTSKHQDLSHRQRKTSNSTTAVPNPKKTLKPDQQPTPLSTQLSHHSSLALTNVRQVCHRLIHSHPRTFFLFTLTLVTLIFLALYLLPGLPSPTQLTSGDIPVATNIYDRNGQLLYQIYADQNRSPIKLADLPAYVPQATIAIEDKNFYSHNGFALTGIIRAAFNTLFGGQLQGGSTITQQLVKNALLTPERTLRRKMREALLSIAVELKYSKNEILTLYLNQVPYGGTAWGIESAARQYFNKPASQLSLAEASLLAGLPQAPTRYSPFGANPELAKVRQRQVLRRMVEDRYITSDQADQAYNTPLNYALNNTNIYAPHFVMYVKEQLVEKYGQRLVEQGGLRVTTTLDLDIQQMAQATVSAEIARLKRLHVGNGAALVTKPATGEILAMVGSKDYFNLTDDGNVNVTTALRQPGSSIKPINYALAFLKGYTPATTLLDIKTCFNVPGQPPYCPRNYDGAYHGAVQLRFALANSYNIPAVKVLALNGLKDFVATASAMGITSFKDPSNYGLSLTLGGGEVTMADMAVAYGVFANAGRRQELHSILKVTDYTGKTYETYDAALDSLPQPTATHSTTTTSPVTRLIASVSKSFTAHAQTAVSTYNSLLRPDFVPPKPIEFTPQGDQVLPPAVTYLISHILLDNNARAGAFGSHSLLRIKNHPGVSVKTGTTNDLKDNWTIGYTPDYLTAVWVGNNDASPMNPYLTSGVTGAAPIWNGIMTQILKNEPDRWPAKPENVVNLEVCATTGRLPGDSGCPTRWELFIDGTQPTEYEPTTRRQIWIDTTTNRPPEPGQLEHLELQEHTVLSDPFTADYCLDCPAANP